jgi:8-oxo-dGTP diphosphatase
MQDEKLGARVQYIRWCGCYGVGGQAASARELHRGAVVDPRTSCTHRRGYGPGVDFTEYDTRLAAYAVIVDDRERILLTWYNGKGRGEPGWTLPGGGVEYAETLEEAVVREVREETGYIVDLDRPLATDSFTDDGPRPRPFKSVRVIYTAHIAGGSLGTLEREGTTDRRLDTAHRGVAGRLSYRDRRRRHQGLASKRPNQLTPVSAETTSHQNFCIGCRSGPVSGLNCVAETGSSAIRPATGWTRGDWRAVR